VLDPSLPAEHPTFADGVRGMHLIEKVLDSSRKQSWVDCA
jgi:hypothetical protein